MDFTSDRCGAPLGRDTLDGGSGENTEKGLATEIDLAFTLLPDWLDRS